MIHVDMPMDQGCTQRIVRTLLLHPGPLGTHGHPKTDSLLRAEYQVMEKHLLCKQRRQ